MKNKKWLRLLAYVTGGVNQELLLQIEYLTAENRILRTKLPTRLRLSDTERATLVRVWTMSGGGFLRCLDRWPLRLSPTAGNVDPCPDGVCDQSANAIHQPPLSIVTRFASDARRSNVKPVWQTSI